MARDDGKHRIGYVADRVGLSLRTVRYYEEVGLVEPTERTGGGFRLYTDEDIARLRLIKQLKPLDFSLDEVRELTHVRDRLVQGDLSDQERATLAERLAGYIQVAEQRCDQLRGQLTAIEDVTEQLRSEIGAHRRRPTRTPQS